MNNLENENMFLKEIINTYYKYEIKRLNAKINKTIEILKDTSVDMPSTLLMETIDYARHILGDKENE